MQWWKKAPEPGISPDDAPGRHSDHYGAHAGETSHIQSIPALARRIVDELPEKFDFLTFSAVVYRYEIAQVWWIDIAVFGLDADDIDSPLGEATHDGVWTELNEYSWEYNGLVRFAIGTVRLLTPAEQDRYTPGHVAVRRFHLRQIARAAWRHAGEPFSWGALAALFGDR